MMTLKSFQVQIFQPKKTKNLHHSFKLSKYSPLWQGSYYSSSSVYLHELEGSFKVFHWVHFDAEKLESHDEADGGLDDVRALLFLPQLLELGDELLPHCWEPAEEMVTRYEQVS